MEGIRRSDSARTIYVPAYAWDGVRSFAACHPRGPWVDDPAGNLRYEAHHYFDFDGSGSYQSTYAQEKAWASTKAQPQPSC